MVDLSIVMLVYQRVIIKLGDENMDMIWWWKSFRYYGTSKHLAWKMSDDMGWSWMINGMVSPIHWDELQILVIHLDRIIERTNGRTYTMEHLRYEVILCSMVCLQLHVGDFRGKTWWIFHEMTASKPCCGESFWKFCPHAGDRLPWMFVVWSAPRKWFVACCPNTGVIKRGRSMIHITNLIIL